MKTLKASIILIASSLFILGCGEPEIESTKGVNGNIYTCKSDCAIEWKRSKIWIARHSIFPITHTDNNMIQTARSTTKRDDTTISFTAIKTGNKIELDMFTDNPFALNADTKYIPKGFFKYIATGQDPINKDNVGYNIK